MKETRSKRGRQSALRYEFVAYMPGQNGSVVDRQHLFLLCGLPFSGKSTLGRSLQARLGIVHVEVDRYHFDGRTDFVERPIERAEWIAAYKAAYRQAEAALDAGQSVVFDA